MLPPSPPVKRTSSMGHIKMGEGIGEEEQKRRAEEKQTEKRRRGGGEQEQKSRMKAKVGGFRMKAGVGR